MSALEIPGGWCKVTRVTVTKDPWYRWHVEGVKERTTGNMEFFSWSVPDLGWFGFDFTGAELDEKARAELESLKAKA